jgi:hypothetical protein
MREAQLTDRQKIEKGLYGSCASRVSGQGVAAQWKDGSQTRRGGGTALNSTATELTFTRRRAMRAIVKGFVIAVFAAASLALVTAAPSEARPRPTIFSIDDCTGQAGSGKGCEGAICYCCYDDGCYICNRQWSDCTWDPKYPGLKSRGVTRPGTGGVLQPLTTVPPRQVTPPAGGTLQK